LSSMVQETFSDWVDQVVDFLPDLGVALLIIILFAIVAKLMRAATAKALSKVANQQSVVNLLARLVYIIIVVIGVLFALRVIELDGAVASVLAGAGIIGIALGFAFQDIASNFIAGIVIAIQKQFNVGDLVEVSETFGIVRRIELRTTTIQTLDGQIIYVPNKDIFTAKMVDYSHLGRRRIDLSVGVSYGDDLEKAEKLALKAVNKVEGILSEKPVDLYYEEFGESSINFTIRFWIKFSEQTNYLKARSHAIKNIKKAFDDGGITIPFPITTLNFDGPVGNKPLSEHIKAKSQN